jgi:signal transduction histidine kinase
MAEDAAAAPNLKTRITRAHRGVRRAIAIMDEILALARAGGRSEPGAHVSLHEVIDTVVADSLADAERAGARLVVEPFVDLEVACGEGPMQSVIANLVRNAVKYIAHSSSRERWIHVRAERRGDRAHVEVEDNGPGLPPGTEASIFELFVRGRSYGEPGLGLGLATVRRIVGTHGGEVGVRSSEGEGSCFWLELPLAPHELAPLVTH